MERVIIFDTTLRDGEQTPGVNLNIHEKLEIARALEKMGVDVMEAGFPAASPGDFECVKAVSAAVKNSRVCALCRAVPADIHRGWEAVAHAEAPRIHTFIATSPIHMQYKLKMTPDEVYERAIAAVKLARSLCPDVEFSPEDGSRSDPAFLYRILEAVIQAGATTLNIPDTVGYTTPEDFERLIRGIRENVPSIHKAVISVHCHDDLGLALANSMAGVRAGARQVECTINGLGERAGNAALEEVVMGLSTRSDYYGFAHNIDTTQIYRTSRLVSSLTGVDVPLNKPVVGGNAFRHESGIHQHGVMSERTTYEIMTPESIGMVQSQMVLGKHSGRHAFVDRMEQLGYDMKDKDVDGLFAKFKELADRKKDITDRDLEALAGAKEIAPVYELDAFQIQSGNKINATASITLKREGKSMLEAAVGDGPVDAAFNAIDKIVGLGLTLESYGIRAVTEGKDALGEVTVRVSCGERMVTGKGLDTDVIQASIRAYIAAINRLVYDMGMAQS